MIRTAIVVFILAAAAVALMALTREAGEAQLVWLGWQVRMTAATAWPSGGWRARAGPSWPAPSAAARRPVRPWRAASWPPPPAMAARPAALP